MSELIDWRVNLWDREFIESKFHRDDAEAILRIPLSRRPVSDVIFWLHTKNKEYSVKSVYHTTRLISRQDNDMGESLRAANGCPIWAKLWKLQIPNKIKVFGWRACQDALPTRMNLVCQRII